MLFIKWGFLIDFPTFYIDHDTFGRNKRFSCSQLTTPLFLTINVLPGTIVTPSERKFVFTD